MIKPTAEEQRLHDEYMAHIKALENEMWSLRALTIDMATAIIEHYESDESGCVFCHASAMDPHSADCIVPKAREVEA